MTLSNSSGGDQRRPTLKYWGGQPTWTDKEKEAIEAQRADGDNINTIIICCMDPLTGDIYVFVHELDAEKFGAYILHGRSFKATDYAAALVPARHRSVAQLQKWLDRVGKWMHSPPAVVIHLHPEGEQDFHYAKMRPKVAPEAKHIYGLGCFETRDKSLSHSRNFLSTRASLFDKPDIGDNFIATLEGKDSVERVKAFNTLFAGADNTAIGNMGEMIALDVMLARGAKAATKHPGNNHHYDILYAT